MSPLSALSLAFQWPALLLVALSATLLALLTGGTVSIYWVFFILPIWMMITWIIKYGFALLEAAANGEKVAPVASTEMMGPFGDVRAWAVPIIGSGLAIAAWYSPPPLRIALIILALGILPLAMTSMAVSDQFLDAFNPLAWWRSLRGIGSAWPMLAAALGTLGVIGLLAWRAHLHRIFGVAVVEMLFLSAHALVGGIVHARRHALDFTPRHSPERARESVDAARALERQRMFDEVYTAVRVRRDDQAVATLDRWLANCDARQTGEDIPALVAAGQLWNEPRGYGAVLRHLITVSCEKRRPAQALTLVEHALTLAPGFAPDPPEQVIEIARYATQTGRRRTAVQLLGNALVAAPPESRPALEALRSELSS
ncbi:MAG: hypothetical protein RL030_705 [Pseudomonadota bacterium]|jgi:hypothetical protein